MGNRGVIQFKGYNTGVYLHWNGGRDSVEAFLLYCKLQGYRGNYDHTYGLARLTQVAGNFFGGSTSLGVGNIKNLDCGCNGIYVIEDWVIVKRKRFTGIEQTGHDLYKFLKSIDTRMPKGDRMFKNIYSIKGIKAKIEELTRRANI